MGRLIEATHVAFNVPVAAPESFEGANGSGIAIGGDFGGTPTLAITLFTQEGTALTAVLDSGAVVTMLGLIHDFGQQVKHTYELMQADTENASRH